MVDFMNILLGLIVLSPVTALIPALYIIKQVKEKKIVIEFNYWTVGLLLLFGWSVIVGIINGDFLSTIGSFLLLLYFFVAVGSKKLIQDKFTLNRAIKVLVYFTVIAAIIGIIEKIIFALVGNPTHRIFSTFGNPNMTGSWFASSLFLLFYLANIKDESKNIKKYWIFSVIIIIAMLLTGSRGACVATIGTSIVIGILMRIKFNRKTLIVSSVIFTVILFVAFGEVGIVSKYVTAHPLIDSISPRLKVWSGGVDMFLSKPLTGWGILATMTKGVELVPLYNMNVIHVHNLWLMFLSSFGVVGFSIYIYMKTRLFVDLYKLFFINRDLALLFIALNSIVIIQGIIDVSLFAPQLCVMFVATGSITQRIVAQTSYAKSLNISLGKALNMFN